MKILSVKFFIVLIATITISCAGSNSSTDNQKESKSKYQPTSIPQLLNEIPGVTVFGNRVGAGAGQALIIVNGNRVEYETLVNMYSVYQIKSARLSRSLTELKMYTNSPDFSCIIYITAN